MIEKIEQVVTSLQAAVPPKLLPPVGQIAMIVSDMDEAVQRLSKVGFGPWYRPISKRGGDEYIYKGRKVHAKVTYSMCYWGTMQIELITSQGEATLYSDFLDRYGEGVQHVCSYVMAYERRVAAFRAAGYEPVQTGLIISKGGTVSKFCYYDLGLPTGLCIELSSSRGFGIFPVKQSPFMMKVGVLTGDMVRVG